MTELIGLALFCLLVGGIIGFAIGRLAANRGTP